MSKFDQNHMILSAKLHAQKNNKCKAFHTFNTTRMAKLYLITTTTKKIQIYYILIELERLES